MTETVRVFISYAQESDEHQALCRALADRLRVDGVDAWIDRYETMPPVGWPRWMQQKIDAARFVILVCTSTYRRRFEGEAPGSGRGANFEGLISTQILYENGSRNEKFVPVVFEGASDDDVPLVLRPFTRYTLWSGYEALYRHLTHQPAIVPPSVGPRRVMPPRFGAARPASVDSGPGTPPPAQVSPMPAGAEDFTPERRRENSGVPSRQDPAAPHPTQEPLPPKLLRLPVLAALLSLSGITVLVVLVASMTGQAPTKAVTAPLAGPASVTPHQTAQMAPEATPSAAEPVGANPPPPTEPAKQSEAQGAAAKLPEPADLKPGAIARQTVGSAEQNKAGRPAAESLDPPGPRSTSDSTKRTKKSAPPCKIITKRTYTGSFDVIKECLAGVEKGHVEASGSVRADGWHGVLSLRVCYLPQESCHYAVQKEYPKDSPLKNDNDISLTGKSLNFPRDQLLRIYIENNNPDKLTFLEGFLVELISDEPPKK